MEKSSMKVIFISDNPNLPTTPPLSLQSFISKTAEIKSPYMAKTL